MITRAASSNMVMRALSAVVIVSLLVLAGSVFQILSTSSQISAASQLDNARERYVSSLKDMETAYRGYVITGLADFLEPYNTSRNELASLSKDLEAKVAAAGMGDAGAGSLISRQQALLNYATALVDARGRSFAEAQTMVSERKGKVIMDGARHDSEVLHASIVQDVSRLDERVRWIYTPLASLAFLALALSAIAWSILLRRSREISTRSRQLLAEVMERSPIGVALVDANSRVVLMNASFAKMAGASSSLRGATLSEIAPAIGANLQQNLQHALLRHAVAPTGEAVDAIFNIENATGTQSFRPDVFPLQISGIDGQETKGAGVLLTDVTQEQRSIVELQNAKDEAEAANRAKSAFIANMSHELRTPLTAVLGYCELIQEDFSDLSEPEILGDLKKISLNARHLLGLINDVLDLSKIEAQKMDVHAVDIQVSALISELEAATGSLVSKKDNRFTVSVEGEDFALHTDDLKVKQILLNLIGNAAKFTERGTISLHASTVEVGGVLHAKFVIQDTGIGMTAEQVAGLFQRFSQADQTTTRKFGGTGLGLALTRALASMLGGTIEVESAPGKGSTFTLVIPAHFIAPSTALEQESEEIGSRQKTSPDKQQGMTVLVVDDEAAARDLLTRHLIREGFQVDTAVNGKEALAKIAVKKPLAVMLDVLMPGMDGWHVLQAIRNNPTTADLPVIMQTVLDDDTFAYAMGATSFLKKPIKRTELSDVLFPFAQVAARNGVVLVVDDDVEACERLKAMLEKDKWSVRIAHNGVEGLEAMNAKVPDLVLVDIMMPEMDGHSFIRAVRNTPKYDAVPLVVLTAADVRSARIRSLASETAAIVQKGSQPLSTLVADLRRVAANSKDARGAEE